MCGPFASVEIWRRRKKNHFHFIAYFRRAKEKQYREKTVWGETSAGISGAHEFIKWIVWWKHSERRREQWKTSEWDKPRNGICYSTIKMRCNQIQSEWKSKQWQETKERNRDRQKGIVIERKKVGGAASWKVQSSIRSTAVCWKFCWIDVKITLPRSFVCCMSQDLNDACVNLSMFAFNLRSFTHPVSYVSPRIYTRTDCAHRICTIRKTIWFIKTQRKTKFTAEVFNAVCRQAA